MGCAPGEAERVRGGKPGDEGPVLLDSAAATEPSTPTTPGTPNTGPTSQPAMAPDLGLSAGLHDALYGNLKSGRACLAADFDNDGRTDIYFGNPGDQSHWMRNVTEPGGPLAFTAGQILSSNGILWAGAAADYDNDGDVDLYLAAGGNERDGVLDQLFRNTGNGVFEEVTTSAGILQGVADQVQTGAGVNFVDVDEDGWLDIFVSVNLLKRTDPDDVPPGVALGRNRLFRNLGDGTFVDVAGEAGLSSQAPTRHSSWLDFDNDGDLDLFENNLGASNILWRNDFRPTGSVHFTDVTREMSLNGHDLSEPVKSTFSSAVGDFNQDGWEDIFVFSRGRSRSGPYRDGHVLFLNVAGQGFVEASPQAGFNAYFDPTLSAADDPDCGPGADRETLNLLGVMGSSLGDINRDGVLDIYVGNGGPPAGQFDQLFLSTGMVELEVTGHGTVRVPTYLDATELVDYPAEQDPNLGAYPAYPYRAHGTCIVDLNGDGVLEVVVANGGPAAGSDDDMQEPNRAFTFVFDEPAHWLAVRPVGDGVAVNRSALGTLVRAEVRDAATGSTWWVSDRLRSANGFSAQHGPDVYLGLGSADEVLRVEVVWPDGEVSEVPSPTVDQRYEIRR
jgi:hypothetical protein